MLGIIVATNIIKVHKVSILIDFLDLKYNHNLLVNPYLVGYGIIVI